MNLCIKKFTFTVIMMVMMIPSANAVVIDFNESLRPNEQIFPGASHFEDGFRLFVDQGSVRIPEDISVLNMNGFDSKAVIFDALFNSIILTSDNNEPFDFLSITVGHNNTFLQDGVLQFEGTFSGGGTISTQVVATDGNVQIFTPVGFSNLVSLRIFNDFNTGLPGLPTFPGVPIFDDIILANTNVSEVPLPAAFWFMSLGIAILGLTKKKT